MTKSKLKSYLIDEIKKTDDIETLEILQTVIESRKIVVPELTEELKRIIKESEEIIKKGKLSALVHLQD